MFKLKKRSRPKLSPESLLLLLWRLLQLALCRRLQICLKPRGRQPLLVSSLACQRIWRRSRRSSRQVWLRLLSAGCTSRGCDLVRMHELHGGLRLDAARLREAAAAEEAAKARAAEAAATAAAEEARKVQEAKDAEASAALAAGEDAAQAALAREQHAEGCLVSVCLSFVSVWDLLGPRLSDRSCTDYADVLRACSWPCCWPHCLPRCWRCCCPCCCLCCCAPGGCGCCRCCLAGGLREGNDLTVADVGDGRVR